VATRMSSVVPGYEVCGRAGGICGCGLPALRSIQTRDASPQPPPVCCASRRSRNYGDMALRMSLIERHLRSLQSRIIETVRQSIGCERARCEGLLMRACAEARWWC
jgi:hypothetical protein